MAPSYWARPTESGPVLTSAGPASVVAAAFPSTYSVISSPLRTPTRWYHFPVSGTVSRRARLPPGVEKANAP
ncbi:hypothetical protein GCM10010231_14300 [Streptomyces sindenensis]|nr:hypothetical protein GCM10010231_14300 [Streptomyces sindenensis]